MNVYSFITQPFRYSNQFDAAVRTAYPLAREVEMDGTLTNLADANTIAAALFAILKTPKQRFEVAVLGCAVITPAMFDGIAPCALLTHPRFGLSAGKVVVVPDFSVDPGTNQTILRCWG